MSKLSAIFLIFTAFALPIYAQGPQCQALILQGGGDKGAFQAGVISSLVNKAPAGTTAYDVVSGISIGAINAAIISQYPKGQEVDMANQLVSFWENLKASDIYKNWFGGVVQGLLFEPSLYDTTPGVEYMKKLITKTPQRFVSVGTTNIDNAVYTAFNNFNGDVTPADFISQVFASYALPAIFPYVVINGTAYFDGGAVMSLDVSSAITKCREITGGNDDNIFIDVVLLTSSTFKTANASNYNGIKMLVRMLELMSYDSAVSGLVQAKNFYPNVQWRYLIQPSKALPDSALPINFDHDQIVQMITQGQQDAIASIQAGVGASFQQYLKDAEFILKTGNREAIDSATMEKYMEEFGHFVKDQLKNQENEAKTETVDI